MLVIEKYIGVALIVVRRKDGTNAVLMYEGRENGLWDFPCGLTDNGTARNAVVFGTEQILGLKIVPIEQVGNDYLFQVKGKGVTCLKAYYCVIKGGELVQESKVVKTAKFLGENDTVPEAGRKLWDVKTEAYPNGITADILENVFKIVDGQPIEDDQTGHLGDHGHAAAV